MTKRVDPTAALRAKRYRQNKKAPPLASTPLAGTAGASGPAVDHASPVGVPVAAPSSPPPAVNPLLAAPAASTAPTLHETVPIVISGGPERFAAVLELPAGEGGTSEPFAPPPTEPTKPPLTDKDVAMFALVVTAYWKMGTAALLIKFPELPQVLEGFHPEALALVDKHGSEIVHAAATAVGIKYGFRIPYQDEVILAAAIGIASFGLVVKRPALEAPRDANPAPTTEGAAP